MPHGKHDPTALEIGPGNRHRYKGITGWLGVEMTLAYEVKALERLVKSKKAGQHHL